MTHALFSCARNEGPFLLEWVLHHRLLGFSRVILFTNDNTDGSDRLLDVLNDRGWIEHHRHSPDHAPQIKAAETALDQGMFGIGDWVMWLDLDEYLNIHVGNGHLNDLLQRLPDCSGIALNWRIFGSSGVQTWPGRQISDRFVMASARQFYANAQVKTLFRFDRHIDSLYIHRPTFNSTDFIKEIGPFFGGDGLPVQEDFYMGRRRNGVPIQKTNCAKRFFRHAQVNHYAVRSPDMYERRKARGLGDRLDGDMRDRHNDAYFRDFDRNRFEDASILRYTDALDAAISAAEGDPEIRAALDLIN